MQRRAFLTSCAFGVTAVLSGGALPADEPVTKRTYTFKTVDKCDIKADVYRPEGDRVVPVVIYVHGGALIGGDRRGVDGRLRDLSLKAGYAVVSIDYRLAPETKLAGILEDLKDACRWVHDKGPELFRIDAQRIAIAGGSAGGYLTLCSGFLVEPRPRALVAFWGYGDVAAEWYSKPDPFYRTRPLVPKEEAYKAVYGPVLSELPAKHERGKFYLYCRQNGLWPKEVTGHDPDKEPKAFDPFCPVRNVSAKYPPTLLIHGTKDTDVPYEQSLQMAQELSRQKVEHELITVQDGGHGLSGTKPDEVAKVYERVMEFLKKKLK